MHYHMNVKFQFSYFHKSVLFSGSAKVSSILPTPQDEKRTLPLINPEVIMCTTKFNNQKCTFFSHSVLVIFVQNKQR